MNRTIVIAICTIATLACCRSKPMSSRFADGESMADIAPASETFRFSAESDTLLISEHGVRVFVPKGSLLLDGEPATGDIDLELASALDAEDMVKNGLSTVTTEGGVLESKGMAFLAFSKGGKALTPAESLKPRVELPVTGDTKGYKAYRGFEGKKGSIAWGEPKEIKTYLTTLDAEQLNFLPDGFVDTCKANQKILGLKHGSMAEMETLYASLITWKTGMQYTDPSVLLNENVLTGLHTINGVMASKEESHSHEEAHEIDSKSKWPKMVLLLKTNQYKNTLIRTKAFEQRVRALLSAHLSDVAELVSLYVKNLHKNMWETDVMLADYLHKFDPETEAIFRNFAAEKTGNVDAKDETLKKLSEAYERALKRIGDRVATLSNQMEAAQQKENTNSPKLQKEYKGLLQQRENYRMQTLGFTFEGNGWYNVDIPAESGCKKNIDEAIIDVQNASVADRVFVYAFISNTGSMVRLQPKTISEFTNAGVAMPADAGCKCHVTLLAVGIKGKQWFLAESEDNWFEGSPKKSMTLKAAGSDELKATFGRMDKLCKGGRINSISKDLQFQQQFYEQYQKQQANKRKYDVLDELEFLGFAHWFLDDYYVVEKTDLDTFKAYDRHHTGSHSSNLLINAGCFSCHYYMSKSTGPMLAGIRKKHSVGWVYQFLKDARLLQLSGDAYARKLSAEWGNSMHVSFPSGYESRMVKNIIWELYRQDGPEADKITRIPPPKK